MIDHGGAKQLGVGDVEQVVVVAAARDESMSLDHHVIVLRKANKAVDRVPIVVPWRRVDERPLHLILGGKTLELLGEDGCKLRIIEIGLIDGSGSDENTLACCFLSQRASSCVGEGVCSFGSGEKRGDECCGTKGPHGSAVRHVCVSLILNNERDITVASSSRYLYVL